MITWAEQFHHSESQVQLKSENGNHSEISLIKQTKIFDEMFSLTRLYNTASYQCVRPVRIQAILMSIVFHNYKKLFQLSKSNIKFAMDLT